MNVHFTKISRTFNKANAVVCCSILLSILHIIKTLKRSSHATIYSLQATGFFAES